MKGKLFLAFWIFFALQYAKAQSATDSSFTLQQCIDYAMKNQADVVNAGIDIKISEGKIRETRAIGYPQITGTVQLVDNPQLKRMYLKNGINPFYTDPSKPYGSALAIPNLFQLRSAGDASATLKQLIFDGSYIVGLQAAKTYREQAQQTVTQTSILTIQNVTLAYYQALINKEIMNQFINNLQRLDSNLAQTKASNEAGYAENIDVSRLEVQYNNTLTDKQNFENTYELSLIDLKFKMGMPVDKPIHLSENISSIEPQPEAVNAQGLDYTHRIDYTLLQTKERLMNLDLKRIKYSRLPTLSAFGTAGMFIQDIKFSYLFQHSWYPYNLVGLNLNIPILDLRSQYQAKQARLNVEKTRNSLNNLKNKISTEVESSKRQYLNSLKSMENQKRNMELAAQVAKITKIKYNEGVGTNLEVVNAESDLIDAQIKYYQALFNALVAEVNYKNATGTLYNAQ